MPPLKKTRDLARSLVASETDASATSVRTEPATLRVYEQLRRQLGAAVGTDGFRAIASRALALAKSESPRLSAVQIMAKGEVCGLREVESLTNPDEGGDAGIVLIAQLLGLFLTFLGEATTLRLIEDLRLQADSDTPPAMPTQDTMALDAVFEDLLLEIEQLRRVSARIEVLAGRHLGMEDGLTSVAGNLRSIATVLDVFVLIRSQAGDSQEQASDLQTNLSMN
jgi:hypothetical protein